MHKVCFLVALMLVCALFAQSSFSQIPVVIVEPCPDDDFNSSMGGLTALVTAAITIGADTLGSSMLRGAGFLVGGVVLFGAQDTENLTCFTFTGMVAAGSTVGGGLGIILALIKHSKTPVSPTVSPYWRSDGMLSSSRLPSIPPWDLGVYRRGLKLTYRF